MVDADRRDPSAFRRAGDAEKALSEDAHLADAAMALLGCRSADDVYEVICDFMALLAPRAVIIVDEITPDMEYFITRKMAGADQSVLAKATDLVGFQFIGKQWPIPPALRDGLLSAKLVEIPGGFAELAAEDIPHPIAKLMTRVFGVSGLFVVGIADRENVLGNFAIVTRTPEVALPAGIIESFARHCYSALAGIAKTRELQRLAEALDHVSAFIYLKNRQHEYVYANASTLQLFGCSAEELVGSRDARFFPPDTVAHLKSVDDRVLEHGENTKEEIHSVDKSGHGRVYWEVKSPLYETVEGGEIWGLCGVSTDITDRHSADEALRDSEERLAALAQQSRTIAWEVDADGLYTYISPVVEIVLGYKPDEIVGRLHFYDLHPEEGRDAFKKAALEVFEAKGSFEDLGHAAQAKDVSVLWLSTNGIPILDADGALQGYRGSDTDMTERHEAEEALRASEEKFRAVFESANDGIFLLSSDGALVSVNAAFAEMHGYAVEEMLTLDLEELETPESALLRPERFSRVLAGEPMSFEVEHYLRDGRTLPLEVSTNLVAIGDEPYILAFHRDITERRQAEARLNDLFSQNQAILAALPDIVAQVDSNKVYTWMNEAGLRFFGDDAIGREAADYFVGQQETYSDVQPVFVGSGDTICVESWQRRLDGESRLLGWWCRAMVDANGAPTGAVLSTAQDITERRQADEALRESEDKFRSMFEQSIVAKSMTAPSGAVLVNQAFCDMLGYTLEEMADRATWQQVTHPDDIAETERVMAAIIAGKMPSARFEKRFVRKDGSVVWADVSSTLRRDAKGDPEYFMTTMLDITEGKKAEKELARQGEDLERTLTSVIDIASNIVEVRDPYTAGHQRRVAELAVKIAHDLGMPEPEIENIRVASLLHDVGKVVVPAEILGKPGSISATEFELLKNHAEAGYHIITSAHMQEPIAELVYEHHERCDGSGYPQGLTCDQMLMGAKVMAVADVVEAMTSHRPYRPALGLDAALAEIEQGAGRLYDAEAARSCIALFREQHFELSP